MSTNKISFGSPTAITCTLAALASGAARQSTKLDFTSIRFLDLLLELTVTVPNLALGSNPKVDVYLSRSIDGTKFSGGCSGVDGAYAANLLQNLQHLGTLYTPNQNQTYDGIFDTVAGPNAALGLPPYLVIVLVNNTGQALTSGAFQYRGLHVLNE